MVCSCAIQKLSSRRLACVGSELAHTIAYETEPKISRSLSSKVAGFGSTSYLQDLAGTVMKGIEIVLLE